MSLQGERNMQGNSDRHLNFNQFLKQRSGQIGGLLRQLQADTKKKGHQGLPKSVRRRAMSHNRYRVPRRLRSTMQAELAQAETMQKVPKCRKHIRKRHKLAMAYRIRSDHCQWLSTHLWATKRMRMKSYYGYKVAFSPNDKCFRSAYRHFVHGCCMVDLSYLQCLVLESEKPGEIFPASLSKIGAVETDKYQQIVPVNIKRQSHLICPGFVIRCPSVGTTLRCFFHPAALEEVKQLDLGSNWKVGLQNRHCDIYMLCGPTSTEQLALGLHKYGIIKDPQTLVSGLYGKKSGISYWGSSQSVINIPKPMISQPIPPQKMLRDQYSKQENTNLRSKMLNLLNGLNSSKIEEELKTHGFWDWYQQGQNKELQDITFKITLRSRYTHRRGNKMTKEQKKAVMESKQKEKREGVMRPQDDKSPSKKQLIEQKKVQVIQPEEKSQEKPLSVMIGQAEHPLLPKGLLLFCSNERSCLLWRILTHQRIRVVGRRQWAHLHLQKKIRLFPEDYPTTQSYKHHQQIFAQTNFKTYVRFPTPKRPHYLSLNSVCPFRAITAQAPFSVWIEMVGKGRCGEHYYICELLPQDALKAIGHLNSNKCPIIVSQPASKETKNKPKDPKMQELEAQLNHCSPIRRVIGSITSGGFIFSLRRQGGIGFIDNTRITPNYLIQSQGYCLVRKPTSPHYLLAQLKPLRLTAQGIAQKYDKWI